MPAIYLDHNASTPQLPAVTRAQLPFLDGPRGNPSSVHAAGRESRRAMEEAREQVANLLGAQPGEIVFTSGATEANNLALQGVTAAREGGLILSAVEHPSVAKTAEHLAGRGVDVRRLPVDAEGRVDPGKLRHLLRPGTVLVSVMLANNETGVVQPIRELATVCREAGVALHVDAAQAAGRLSVDVAHLGADLLSLSGHKMQGPTGIGALWVRQGVSLAALLHGGGQESNRRSGSENVAGAVGLGEAARHAAHSQAGCSKEVAGLRDHLERRLLESWPGAVAHGAGAPRLPNTTLVGFPGLDGEAAVMRLDLEGVAVSLGAACSTGTMRPSTVLAAMGVPESLAAGSLRFSLGPENTRAEMDEVVHIFRRALAPTTAAGVLS
jgi:cysteine desulfurase